MRFLGGVIGAAGKAVAAVSVFGSVPVSLIIGSYHIRNCFGTPTGGAPFFDCKLTLKNHARILAGREAKSSPVS